MRADVVMNKTTGLVLALALAGGLMASCADTSSDDAAERRASHAEAVASIEDVLPADARGVFALDVGALLAGPSATQVTALMDGKGGDPVFEEPFTAIGALARPVDLAGQVSSAALVQTTDATDGMFLVATTRSESLDDVVDGTQPKAAGTYGPKSRTLYASGDGNRLALLPGGLLVIGSRSAVESVVDVADGVEPDGASEIDPFLPALDAKADMSFVYGLPALYDESVKPDRTLRGAAVMSGALDVEDGDIGGSLAFHTANASTFAKSYNTLNRNATEGEDPSEAPLEVAAPIAQDLERVVVTLPPSPISASPEDTVAVRNVAKKLFVGMEAHDYVEDVSSTGNAAWIDLIIKSEADKETPPSPGAVFFRWEFKDKAAMEAFAAKELPRGYKLAPTQFLTSDDPEGEYFLALMLYNAGGGSIVEGARAEWDVFVSPPKGADPDAPDRPRYMIIQNLSENVSGDPTVLLTKANPVSYEFVGDQVVSDVRALDGGTEVPVFASSFPKPDPTTAKVARWTPEMAIANDYMQWPNGVDDHIMYNATTYNWDGYFVDTAQTTITDNSRWSEYIKPELKDATYYVNTLEYVASPLANLDSKYLDVTPEEREDLLAFKDNGHQRGIMRGEVEKLFVGADDAFVGIRVANETPSTYYNFEITDPDGLEAALDLPDGSHLAPTTLFEGGDEAYSLTLRVYEVDDAVEGQRAEWSVAVDDGSGRPHQQILDLMTADVGIDPVSIINLPSEVRHEIAGDAVSTRVSSDAITFDAGFTTKGSTDESLTLNWIETGDNVCYANGICDKYYYDAETLDVPVHRASDVTVDELATPWDEFISATPSVVFYRDNAQEYVVKRWHNLKVKVEAVDVSGLEAGTHEIGGTGTLVGRTSTVANSTYTYTGDAVVEGDELTFSIDQKVDNALGVSHIYTKGSFDLTTGDGTQTLVDCQGPALMCSDFERGAEKPFTAENLNASNRDAITWTVGFEYDLGSSFGMADSASFFTATRSD